MLADPRIPLSTRADGYWASVFLANVGFLALIILLSFAYTSQAFSPTPESMIRVSSVVLLMVYLWTVWSWWFLTRSIFNPYTLFLTAAYLFNGGQTFLEIFGLNQLGIMEGQFSQETVLKTIFLITIGFLSLHTGALLSNLLLRGRTQSENRTPVPDSGSTEQFTRFVGWGLLVIAIVPAILTVKNNLTVSLTIGYMGIFTQELAMGYGATGSILANFMIPATIFLAAGSRNFKLNVGLTAIVVLVYCVALFVSGQRGTATMFLVAYAWIYHRCIRPISGWLLVSGGAFLLLIVFPVISVLRSSTTGGSRLSLDNLLSTFTSIDNPLVSSLSEMGFSMTTVAYTVDLIPSTRDFDWGIGYLYGLLGIFPNLFWDVHPSFAHGTPSLWLIETVAPSSVLLGRWGFGYSFIAEAYYSFGWFGAPIALAALGLFLGWLVLWAETSGNVAKLATVGSFAAFVLIFTRGDFLDTFGRPLVWYSLIPFWIVLGLQYLSWRTSSDTNVTARDERTVSATNSTVRSGR